MCVSQLRQFMVAMHSYAQDNEQTFPARFQPSGYPHQIKRIYNYKYNLNPHFIKPYLENLAMLFCPGQSASPSTNVDSEGDVQWATYQYFVWRNGYYWQVPQPVLHKPESTR